MDGVLTEWTWTVEEELSDSWKQTDLKTVDETAEDGTLQRTFILVNTRVITLSGQKYWQKPESVSEDELPEVTITLQVKKNGVTVDELTQTQTVNAANGWRYAFVDVPAFALDGTPYTYEITEPAEIFLDDGVVITQVSAVENDEGGIDLTDRWQQYLPCRKIWNDDSDKFGLRPEAVTFRLTGTVDGTTVYEGSVRLTGTGDTWTRNVTNIPKWWYDEDAVAHAVTYSVTEDDVPCYWGSQDEGS